MFFLYLQQYGFSFLTLWIWSAMHSSATIISFSIHKVKQRGFRFSNQV